MGGGSGKFEVVDIGKFPSPGESRPAALPSTRPKEARGGAAQPDHLSLSLPLQTCKTCKTCEEPLTHRFPRHRRARSSVIIARSGHHTLMVQTSGALPTKHWPRSHPIHRQLPRQAYISFAVKASAGLTKESFFTMFVKLNCSDFQTGSIL